jgi:hypothetical protein
MFNIRKLILGIFQEFILNFFLKDFNIILEYL